MMYEREVEVPRLVGHFRLAPAPASTPPAILEAGSLFVMDYVTQIHYTHGVPQTSDAVGERISLAFRVKRTRQASDAGFYR